MYDRLAKLLFDNLEGKFIKSKILIVCILLVMVVSLSAVVASDVDDTSLSSNNDTLTVQGSTSDSPVLEQVNDIDTNIESSSESDDGGDLLASSNDEDILGISNFNQLQNDINYGTIVDGVIYLTDDYEGSGVKSITRTNVIIDGQGHYIDAQRNSAIFTISAKDGLTFKNIIFKNGYTGDVGAAIRLTGSSYTMMDLTFVNCTFENCQATNGGAIAISNSAWNITIINCTFDNNVATTKGGSIYSNNLNTMRSNVNVYNSTFTNCTATSTAAADGGGAVFLYASATGNFNSCKFVGNVLKDVAEGSAIRYSGVLNVDGCEFYSNSGYDGTIFSGSDTSSATIKNSIFENNTVTRWGGALQVRNAIVENCTFINNTAKNGGAVYSRFVISLNDCKFINNSATEGGGAVHLETRTSSATIDGCYFANNSASLGGALYSNHAAPNNVFNSKFDNNDATSKGGAIYLHSGTPGAMTITTSEFTNNNAPTGGAIYDEGNFLQVTSSKFYNNTANSTVAGAIYSKDLTIKTSELKENNAQTYAGAVYTTSALTIDDSLFEKNSAMVAGAVFTPYISATYANFIDNNASIAGAIEVDGQSTRTSTISDSKFENNRATHEAGALLWNTAEGIISTTDFISNYAGTDAGAIFWKKGKGQITRSTFTDNVADDDGGAIYWEAVDGTITSSNFENNNATNRGGAIYWQGDSGKVISSTLTDNGAKNKGNGIYWYGKDGSISTSTFSDNSDLASIYLHGTDGQIIGNSFDGVKAVYICEHATAMLERNVQNATNYDNYSVYILGNVSLSKNVFHNAIYNYGIILTESSVIVLENSTTITDAKYYDIYISVLDDNGNYIKLINPLTADFDGANYTTTFNNTHYVFKSPYLNLGVHDVKVISNPPGLTSPELKSAVIMYMILEINVTVINDGEKVIVTTVVVNTTENGTIDLIVNDRVYENITLANGTAVLELYDLAPGKYIFTAIYGLFNQSIYDSIDYLIDLRNSTIQIITTNITAGQNITITLNVTNGTTGSAYLFINNNMYILNLVNSTAQINLTNVVGGIYTIFATYNGDYKFKSSYNSTLLNVTKLNTTLPIIVPDNIMVGQTAIITINSTSNLTGTITVYVNGEEYTFTKSPVSFNITNITAGNYTVKVLYSGDDLYNSATNNTTFVVKKRNIVPTITVKDIKVGENATITVNLPENATGMVLLTVNGKNYYTTANATKAIFVISDLPYGKYNVTAIYLEDDIYYTNSTNASFNVDYVDINPNITYSVDNDLNVVVNVTVPSDVNGDIIIEVNGTNYTAPVIKGNFTVPINGLEGGTYPAKMYFAKDTKYRAVNKTFEIVLNKIDIRINITAPSIHVDDNATITVIVPRDAGGNVTIAVNNKTYTVKVVNGTAVFTVLNLTAGTHQIKANYSGDRKYYPDDELGEIIVLKVDPNPYSYMAVDDIFVGEIATINITMPSDLNTKINITVQNKTFIVDIINGSGQVNISGLKYGSPVPIDASFGGTDKYLPCSRTYPSFVVHRITNYPINISATTNTTSANITVTLPDDANGKGNINIDNRTFNVTYVNGVTNITVNGLDPGREYIVVAHYFGDDKYTEGEASKTLNSNKTLDYIFEVSVKDIFVDQTAYIHIYLPNVTNGTITVIVPGQPSTTINVNPSVFVNGSTDYPVNNLPAGLYHCSVTYNGNEKYESSVRYGDLLVSKLMASPIVDFNTTYVGQNLTLRVTLPNDANGTINITIDGRIFPADVINGTAYVIVPGLAAKKYNATLFYSGNEKYNDRTHEFEVTILKISEYQFDVGVMDIYVGDNETITIKLPSNIDVNVTVIIPGTSYINKTIELTNGSATFNVTGLKIGKYNITAYVTNSSIYVDHEVIRHFTVLTIEDYLFKLDNVTTVYVRDNLTFILHLPDDSKGNVTVNIFNNNFTAEVKNGIANVTVPTSKQGNYLFTISFEEIGKYVYKSQTDYAFVIKKDVELNPIYNDGVNVDENITITFKLPSDATGNVSVTSRGVTYTAELVNGTANVTIAGFALASRYSPSIAYTGDDKYNPNTGTITITAHKVSDYNITVNVTDITVDQSEIVNITLPSDATEDVLVSGNFSTNTYSVRLTNGTATYTIKDLAAGTYFINVRYQGYQKYEDKNVTKIFVVRKVVPPIAIDFVNNDTLIVNLPALANGLANITVGNVIKTQINITNGVGSLNVSGLRPGNYSVTATFLGGARYLENSTSINITIPKIKDYILPISVEDIIVYENATIKIIAPYNSTGSMNITIDGGNVIQVPIIEGVATYNATGLKVGNHTVVVNYTNIEYDFMTNSTQFEVNKIKTLIDLIVSGNSNNITVIATLTENVTGNVTIYVDNVPYNFANIKSNVINITVPAIPKEHDIRAIYSGDENHTDADARAYIETHKITDYLMNVTAIPVITVLDNNIITVKLPIGATGDVHIYINDMSYAPLTINSTTGIATFTVPNLLSGNYTVVADFSNAYYEFKENTTNFTVIKLNTTIDVEVNNITIDLTEIINITVNESATGQILVNVNGTVYSVDLDEGKAVLTLSNLNEGNYSVVVTYVGDNYYNSNFTTAKFTVSRIPVNITITGPDTIIANQTANFVIETSRPITDIVNVTIGNKNYTAVIYNGKGNLIVSDLPTGNFTATVIYAGDENYLPATNETKINVTAKKVSAIDVNVTDIYVDQSVTIYVNVTGKANGRASVVVAGEAYVINLKDGKGNVTISNLSARHYHVSAFYLSDDEYLTSNTTAEFEVFKYNSTISLVIPNSYVGDLDIANLTVTENATGTVLITVGDLHIYVELNGTNKLQINLTEFEIGTYNVNATYLGDDKFYGSTTNTSFNVTKKQMTINITSDKVIVVGHPVIFTIETSANITEVVIVKIINNDTNAVILTNHTFVENGKGTFIVYDLAGGNYTAEVLFPGNTQYDEAENSTNFTVSSKSPTSLNVSVEDITLGEDAIVYVNVTGALTGKVTLNIAGMPQTKDVVDGKVNFTVSGLAARDYHLTVTYIENDDYLSSTDSTDFTVRKKTSNVSINASNILVGETEVFNVTVSPNATGHVLIIFANVKLYVDINESSNFSVPVADLPVGEYNVTIIYSGDSNYTSSYGYSAFNITKRATTINITCDKIIIEGHAVTFNITTDSRITEVVIIRVNGTNYTSFVVNGKGTYTVYNLPSGNHTAYVYLDENSRFYAVNNHTNFTVTTKLPVSLTINVNNITLGENATVYVTVTDLEGNSIKSGKVTLNIAGRPQTKDVVDGKVNFTVTDLAARDYHVTATYLGTDDYLANTTTADFTVFKKQSEIKINVSDIFVGQNETITVNVTANATGIVLIDIAGVQVYARLNNSNVVVIFDDLGLGEYNVTATYLGDENYFGNSTNASFKVTKLDTTIVIEGSNITVGQTETFNITTSANITEVITIEINGNNYTTFIENGNGTFTVPYNLAVGNYTVYAYFPGNSKYDKVQNSTNITVSPKKASAVTVNVTSINVGDKVTIYVNVTEGTTGTVVISLAGNAYSVLLNNSKANFTIENLTARNYHVTAFYFGDDYYLPSNGTADFTVNKKESQVNVTAVNITVDQDETITISITNGTTGVVLIDINGTDYYANIVNGEAKLVVKNLAVGNYTVTVNYNGDAIYNASTNSTKFKVTKLNSEITVAVVGVTAIAQGNDVLINMTGPKDVTGVAIVTVSHADQSQNYTVYINNGQGSLIVSKPHVAHYNVTAKYTENYKYLSNISNTVGFEVYANGSSLDVDTHNIYVGENETITVTVAGNYEGKVVNITIDGTINLTATLKYNSATNSSVGIVNYTDRLIAGIHQVDAAFVSEETDRNIAHSGSAIFIVSKNNSTVGINAISDIKVGQDVTITLTLAPEDATGVIDVYVNGVLHKVDVNNLTLTISNLTAGRYVVQAMYNGDDKYLASSANASFEVFKNNITIKLEVEDIDVGQTQYLNVTLESDATGYVLININGTHYYAEIKDGVASVNINDLGLGKYNVSATFIGDDKYYGNATTGNFTVSKLDTTIVIKGHDIIVGQDEVLTITTSANITEVVYIEIDGVNHTAFITNGEGNFTLSGLAVKEYSVKVYFPGNSKYGAIDNETTFKVTDKHPTSLNVTVADITVGENITVYINATKGINGPVYVTIGGVAYTRELVDGKVNFTVSGLTARDYVISAFFMGNTEYELCNNTSNFTVHKKDTPISMEVTNIHVGDNEIINVTVNSNATGNVLISIGSIHVYAELENGRASVNITGLGVGKHNVTVTYEGDANYTGNSTTGSFNVSKREITITINTNATYVVGQPVVFTFSTSENITEVVTITIGDKIYHTFVENGTGNYTVYDLTVDSYIAVINFPGNTQFNATQNETKFEVIAKKPTDIKIDVESITVGKDLTVNVTVTAGATGNVTIIIAGNEYTQPIGNDGVARFNIENLTARHYEVTAIYNGDVNYLGNSTKGEFNVIKFTSNVELNVSDIVVGDTEIINVTVTPGATGVVLINISGTCYYADLKDGMPTFKVPGLSVGNYEAVVTYLGDEKYAGSTASKTFVVQPEITMTSGVNDGNKTPITIDVGDNSNGTVVVTINGTNYTADVKNGTAVVNVDGSNPGIKDATVTFTPEGKDPISQNTTIDIPKVSEYPVNVEVVNVDKENGTATIKVQAPEDATGNVTVNVNGKLVTVLLDENGTAVVTVKDIPVGSHDIDVSYSGDDKYVSKSNRTHVNMPINLPTVNVVDHLVRGWNSQFDYEAVFTNEFGEVLVNTTVTFIVNGKSYTVKTESHGIARLSETLPVGEYTITSNNTVTGEQVTKKLSIVPRLKYNKDLTMDFIDGSHWDVLVIGDDGNPVGEGEIIDIYVNTIHYVAKTDKDGYARLKINLNPKTYKISAEYKNYKVTNKLVVKQTMKLVKKTVTAKKGKKITIKVKLKWSSGKAIKGKKITIKFKGKKFSAKTNKKGIAKITIKKKSVLKKLKKGKKYSYAAIYNKTNKLKGKVKIK